MPVYKLHTTKNFIIEWSSGADSSGLYVYENRGMASSIYDREVPQFYIDLEILPGFIEMLREAKEPMTLFTRVHQTHMIHHFNRPEVQFVPVNHRVPKKDGGVWGEAYYTPIVVSEVAQLRELADALETACSHDTVLREEERNTSESDYVLNGNYLENGQWASAFGSPPRRVLPLNESVELQPARLEQKPKQRVMPSYTSIPFSYTSYEPGTFVLREARDEHQCYRGIYKSCLVRRWIQPGEHYVEHRHGQSTDSYHIQCAFRSGKIPLNWLNPHFEQYHRLIKLGFEKWIAVEQKKRSEYREDNYEVPLDSQAVREFIKMMKEGYTLDSTERRKWREELQNAPIDVEPYQTARRLIGLTNP